MQNIPTTYEAYYEEWTQKAQRPLDTDKAEGSRVLRLDTIQVLSRHRLDSKYMIRLDFRSFWKILSRKDLDVIKEAIDATQEWPTIDDIDNPGVSAVVLVTFHKKSTDAMIEKAEKAKLQKECQNKKRRLNRNLRNLIDAAKDLLENGNVLACEAAITDDEKASSTEDKSEKSEKESESESESDTSSSL